MSPLLWRKALLKRTERDAFAMNGLSHQAGTGSAGSFHFIRTSLAPSGVPCVPCLVLGQDKWGKPWRDAGLSLLHVHPSLPLLEHALSCTEPTSPMSLGPVWYQGCVNSTHPNTSGPDCRLLQETPGPCKTLVPKTVTHETSIPSLSHDQSLVTPLFFFSPSSSASFAFEGLREPNRS